MPSLMTVKVDTLTYKQIEAHDAERKRIQARDYRRAKYSEDPDRESYNKHNKGKLWSDVSGTLAATGLCLCSKCQKAQPVEAFARRSGLQGWTCKACRPNAVKYERKQSMKECE